MYRYTVWAYFDTFAPTFICQIKFYTTFFSSDNCMINMEEAEVRVSPGAAVEEDTKVPEEDVDEFMPTDEKIHSSHMIDHNYCLPSGNVYIYVGQY